MEVRKHIGTSQTGQHRYSQIVSHVLGNDSLGSDSPMFQQVAKFSSSIADRLPPC